MVAAIFSSSKAADRRQRVERAIAAMRPVLFASVLTLLPVPPASAEWTAGVFAGASRTLDSSVAIAQPEDGTNVTISPVRYRSESFEPPIYYGYRAGFFPAAGWFGLEGELIHMKVLAETNRTASIEGDLGGQTVAVTGPMSFLVERFSISHGVNLILINAVARRRARVDAHAGSPRWMLTARFGAGASLPHPESTVGGESVEGYEWGAFSAQVAAAAEIRIAGPLYGSGEYKLTRTVQDVSIARGSARTPLVTHHVAFGLSVHFPTHRQ